MLGINTVLKTGLKATKNCKNKKIDTGLNQKPEFCLKLGSIQNHQFEQCVNQVRFGQLGT